MELERLAIDDDGMTCIVASRTAGNDVEFAAKSIDNFALAFVAPLGAEHNCGAHLEQDTLGGGSADAFERREGA